MGRSTRRFYNPHLEIIPSTSKWLYSASPPKPFNIKNPYSYIARS